MAYACNEEAAAASERLSTNLEEKTNSEQSPTIEAVVRVYTDFVINDVVSP